MDQVIIQDLENIKQEFAIPRRTKIEDGKEAVYIEEAPAAAPAVFVMDRFGYCKLLDQNLYERSRETVDSEYVWVVPTMTTGRICLFTDTGTLHQIKAADIPLGKLKDRGTPADNLSRFDGSRERVVQIFDAEWMKDKTLLFATKMALVKQVPSSEFETNNRTVAGTKLQEGDQLLSVTPVKDQQDVVLQTGEGIFLRFPLEEIPAMKKASKGVRGIRLAEGDFLEALYLIGQDPVIRYKEKEVHLNRLKAGHRDGKGTKMRR